MGVPNLLSGTIINQYLNEILLISANRDENLGLSIVSIDCSKNGTDDDITIHKVPAMPNGEQPTILKEFQGNY